MSRVCSDVWTLLHRPGFRRLFAVRIAGQLGDGVLQVALVSFVFFSPERQTTAPAAAAAFAVILLPYSLVGPFAGVLLDRWQRRQVLLYVNLLRAGLTLVVAWQVMSDNVGLLFVATVLLMLSLNRFILAGLGASVPRVVPRRELVMANSIAPTAGAVAVMTGVGVGYVTQRWLLGSEAENSAESPIVMVGAAVYLLAGLLALRLGRRSLGPEPGAVQIAVGHAVRQVASGMVSGARHVVARRPAFLGLAVMASSRFFYGLTLVMAILLARNHFHHPDDVDAGLGTLAMLLGLSGAGFALAAVITPAATRRMSKQTWAVTLLAAAGMITLAPGVLLTVPALAVVATVLGVAAQGVKIVVDTVIHENVDDEFRGRVFSFYDVAFNATFVAAAGVAALFMPASGHSYIALGVIAAGFGLTAAGYRFADSGWAGARSPAPVQTADGMQRAGLDDDTSARP
ncbi:MFS transporter [Phytoactinopolyspora mesophila]|uniref:MFS transporter n=1 Tax=Phytoactinopolyspora mesophila TaxID=2650750 RepID=A0A7K3M5G6_9ACTN|nr:MFS transporter [Phytoactinopolyspora mesophila]NDL58561.1 MFS transporter [Phytoactinopolyspora mesophila]